MSAYKVIECDLVIKIFFFLLLNLFEYKSYLFVVRKEVVRCGFERLDLFGFFLG
jgi:hypothetical protein